MAKIIDVRGGNNPVLGRLRGVTARHEIRRTLDIESDTIYFKADDAHLVFREKVPAKLPDALSNTERQLVVTKKLADAMSALEDELETHPVRLVDRAGKTVSSDYVLVAPKRVVNCVEGDGEMIGGYIHGVIKNEKGPGTSPAIFRVGYTFIIACSDEAAAKLSKFSGIELVAFEDYVEELLPFPETAYEILRCGTEGAELRFGEDDDFEDKLEEGVSLQKKWPKQVAMKMSGPKSRKKMVDFTDGGGAPIISEKAKAVLEPFGLEGVELLPVQATDHGGKPVKGSYWLFHVTGTQPYVDIDESDIEVVHKLLWTAREIEVDESRLTARPAFFRVPGARYPWVFVRRDVLDAMTKAKLTGFRTQHPGYYRHSVEGGGIDRVC